MADEIHEDAVVSTPVKEVLKEQTDLLREIDRKVDGKADKADLVPIVTRLEEHHTRLQTIEDAAKAAAAVKEALRSRRRFYGAVVAAVVVPIGCSLIYVLH